MVFFVVFLKVFVLLIKFDDFVFIDYLLLELVICLVKFGWNDSCDREGFCVVEELILWIVSLFFNGFMVKLMEYKFMVILFFS